MNLLAAKMKHPYCCKFWNEGKLLFSAWPFGGASVTSIALLLAMKSGKMWETLI